jgi:hypothetical protein
MPIKPWRLILKDLMYMPDTKPINPDTGTTDAYGESLFVGDIVQGKKSQALVVYNMTDRSYMVLVNGGELLPVSVCQKFVKKCGLF